MLLPDNVHPENTLFLNGARVIHALRQLEEASLLDLFVELRKQAPVPMPILVLSLDWLFLADCVIRNEEGNFILCS